MRGCCASANRRTASREPTGRTNLFAVRLPAGLRNATFLVAGGSGRLRLEARYQAVPDDGIADVQSDGAVLRLRKPRPGLYYIRASGLGAYSGKSLHAMF